MAAQESARKRWVVAAAAFGQLFCWFLMFSSVVVFIAFQFACVLPAWLWAYDDDNMWEKFRKKVTFYWSELLPAGSKMFSGYDAMNAIFTYFPAMLATIVTLLPALLISKDVREAAANWQPMQACSALGRKVARFASYPVWPHRFWLWWSDGLSVFDAFMWSGFLVMHVVATWQMTKYYQAPQIGWDGIGLAYPIPKSVDNLKWISLACAWVLYMDFSIIFFPVTHISFLQPLFGTTWPALVKYHRWIGHFGLWTVTGHALFYYWYWLANPYDNFWKEFFDWNNEEYIVFLAGSISWLFGVALWVTSIAWVRRNYFKVFYVTHIIGFVGFVLFAYIHYYWSVYFMAAGLVVYGLDVVYRVVQGQNVSQVSHVVMTPESALAYLDIPLDTRLGETMQGGQEVFLQFPTFNRWDWHPFTVFKVNQPQPSSDALPSMTLVIKKYGRWTQRLVRELETSISTHQPVPVRLLGPLGRLHDLAHRGASRIIMFVGGIGASPALAHVHNLIAHNMTTPTTVVFTARTLDEFTILDEPVVARATNSKESWLSLKLFHTGTSQAPCQVCGTSPDTHGANGKAAPHTGPHGTITSSKVPPMPAKNMLATTKAGSLEREPEGSSGSDDFNATASSTTSRWLSAYGWRRIRPMQPRLLNDWQMLLAVLMAWTGGVMGLLQAQTGLQMKWGQVLTKDDYWMIGCIFFLCITVQAAGLPALVVLLPVHTYKYIKDRAVQHMMNNVVSSAVPTCQVLGHNKVGLPESGLSVDVASGRPDVRALLREVAAGAEGEVVVVAAGPRALCNDVEKAAWEMNFSRPAGGAFLHVIRETFEL